MSIDHTKNNLFHSESLYDYLTYCMLPYGFLTTSWVVLDTTLHHTNKEGQPLRIIISSCVRQGLIFIQLFLNRVEHMNVPLISKRHFVKHIAPSVNHILKAHGIRSLKNCAGDMQMAGSGTRPAYMLDQLDHDWYVHQRAKVFPWVVDL